MVFYGASGHSHAVALQFGLPTATPQICNVVAFLDDVVGGNGRTLAGLPVVAWEEWLAQYRHLPCYVPIGDGVLRRRMMERVLQAGGHSIRLYDDRPALHPLVDIGVGALVANPGYVGPNTVIGAHAQVMPMHCIGHDVVVGPYATVATSATISGHVHIGEAAFIGAGAVITHGRAGRPLVIGAEAFVAAGAVVLKPVPAGAKVYGNPARTRARIRSRLQAGS